MQVFLTLGCSRHHHRRTLLPQRASSGHRLSTPARLLENQLAFCKIRHPRGRQEHIIFVRRSICRQDPTRLGLSKGEISCPDLIHFTVYLWKTAKAQWPHLCMTGTIGKPHCSPLLSLPCSCSCPCPCSCTYPCCVFFFFDHIDKKKVRPAVGRTLS